MVTIQLIVGFLESLFIAVHGNRQSAIGSDIIGFTYLFFITTAIDGRYTQAEAELLQEYSSGNNSALRWVSIVLTIVYLLSRFAAHSLSINGEWVIILFLWSAQ